MNSTEWLRARRWKLGVLAVLAVSAVAIAACGSDDDSDSGTAAVSQDNPATGTPVVIGAVELQDQPEFFDGVKAAVDYLNEEGGGLLGHRIDLKSCTADQSPQQDIKCANDLASAGSQAVILGEDRSADSAFPIYQKAGVTVITPRVVANQELVNPVAVALGPGIPGLVASIADYVKTELHGDTVVTAIHQGIPQDLLDQLVGGPLSAAGIKSEYVFFAGENPNFASTFAAAAEKDPDLLISDIDENPGCVPAMQAVQQLDVDFKVFQVLCSDDEVLDAAGPLADGEMFYGPVDSITGVDSPDAETFDHIIDTYSETKSTGFNSSLAVSTVMTLQRVLDHQGGSEVTSESVLSAFKNSKGVNQFMGPPLECGTVKAFPAQCTIASKFFTVEDGEKKVLTGYISAPQYLPQGPQG
jgi:branched-chain amino acid transport system substrate-binding protein